MWWGERVRSSATAIITSVTGSLKIIKPYLGFSLFLTRIHFQIFKYDAEGSSNQHFGNIHILVTTEKKYKVLKETFSFNSHTWLSHFTDKSRSAPLVRNVISRWSFGQNVGCIGLICDCWDENLGGADDDPSKCQKPIYDPLPSQLWETFHDLVSIQSLQLIYWFFQFID